MKVFHIDPGEFVMPAEWEPHEATWLVWPHHPTDWPRKLAAVEWAYVEMIRKIAEGEIVRLLVRNAQMKRKAKRMLTLAGVDLRRVQFYFVPTNRSWTRDMGPVFVRRHPSGQRYILHLHFNGWARYYDWRLDRKVPEWASRLLSVPLVHAAWAGRRVVLEGGAIDVNGCGTLITTEECLLDCRKQVRNPGFTRSDYEQAFRKYLGAKRVIWLGRGIEGDDTHGHVDDLCRFVNRTTVVLCRERRKRDPNYSALEENWERIQDARLENGHRLNVVELPMPEPIYFKRQRLPASYANFYISNQYVLVPTFNCPTDRLALGILSELFSDRVVVGIHAVDLVLGLGTIHCLTQQEPREGKKRSRQT